MATITSLGFSIFSTYSGAGTSAARRDLNDLQNDLDKTGKKFSAVGLAAAALGPAILPLGAAAVSVGGGLTTMGVAGGAAAGIIGFAFKAALAGTNESSTQMNNLLNSVKDSMASLGNDVSPMLVEPFRIATTSIITHINDLSSVVATFRPVIMDVATAFRSWTDNNLQGWLNWVGTTGVPILSNFITIGKNLGRTFGDMLKAFSPMAISMSEGMAVLSAKLKGWADGGGFQKFIESLTANGPAIRTFLVNMAEALVNISKALAGMGPGALALLNPLLKLVSILPPSVIQAMVYAYIAWQLAMAGAAIAAFALAVALAVADAAATPFFLALAIAGAPLWLIVAAVVALVAIIAAFIVGLIELANHWDGFIHGMATAGIATWTALQVAWNAFINAMITTWNTVAPALKAAWTATWNALNVAAMAVWNALRVAWAAFINAMNTTWLAVSGALRASWQSVWNALKAAAEAVWNALRAAWSAFFAAMSSVFATFNSGMRSAWSNLWNAVKAAAQAVWNALKSAFSAFFSGLSSVFATFNSGMRTAWSNLWNAVKTTASTVWSSISSGFKTFASGVESTVTGLVSKVKSIWNGIVSAFKDPINLVIGVWNKVAGVFHLPTISSLSGGGVPGTDGVGAGASGGGTTAFATGGYVRGPGNTTDDKIPAMLSNKEFVVNAKAVEHYGVDNMYALNSMKLAGGGLATTDASGAVPKMALGGIIPSPGDIAGAIGGVVGAVGGVLTSAAVGALKDLIGDAFMKAVTPILDGFAPPDPAPTGGITSIPHAAYKLVEKSVLDLLKDASNIGGVIPVGEHKAVIDAALKAAGVPPPGSLAEWEAGLNTLITRESNWDSGAINNTDSNAQAGHPSQGLAQTIPSTFAAYHVAGTSNNILDPVANVAAAIRYIVATYGNITNVQQANANLPPQGYWSGTSNARKGWAKVGERGEEWVNFGGGETVLPHGRKPGGGGDHHYHVSVENHWNGNPDKEAVQYAESDMADSLRQSLHAGVGGRAH